MKLKNLFLTFTITSTLLTDAQVSHENYIKLYGSRMLAWDLGSFYTPLLNKNLIGFNTDLKYYWARRFSTGVNWSIATKKINETYSYTILKPIIYYNELGLINEFEFLQHKWVRMNMNLNNGLCNPYLGDDAFNKHYGSSAHGYSIPKRITSNYYYMLEPGISLSVRFSNYFYLTLKGKYRFIYGKTNFGTMDEFKSYYVGLTLSIISPID
jgi:hypothetical protein